MPKHRIHVTLTLPQEWRGALEQILRKEYTTMSEYVKDLIRQDLKRRGLIGGDK